MPRDIIMAKKPLGGTRKLFKRQCWRKTKIPLPVFATRNRRKRKRLARCRKQKRKDACVIRKNCGAVVAIAPPGEGKDDGREGHKVSKKGSASPEFSPLSTRNKRHSWKRGISSGARIKKCWTIRCIGRSLHHRKSPGGA